MQENRLENTEATATTRAVFLVEREMWDRFHRVVASEHRTASQDLRRYIARRVADNPNARADEQEPAA